MAQIFQRILLATERTEFDAGAERLALALAQRCRRPLAVLMPMVSNPEYEAVAPALAERADRDAATRLAPLLDRARAAGVEIDLRVRRGAELFREIVDDAREHSAELIVIRRRGRRGLLAQLLVGEMVSQVVAHAPCNVLVVPHEAGMWTRCVMLAAEAAEAAEAGAAGERPLHLAIAVAAECALPLHVLCIGAGGDAASRRRADAFVADALRHAEREAVAAEGEVLTGMAAKQIVDGARRHAADLLVMGSGGAAHQVTGLAECAVLLTPHSPSKKDTSA